MRRIDMCCLVAALATSLPLTPAIAGAQRDAPSGPPVPAVWLESGPELAPGQPAQLGYELPRNGYLTVLRANTDGDLSVVYPAAPNSRSKQSSRGAIPMRGDVAPGVGYLFWVTSPTPFDFRQYAGRGGRWATGGFGGRGDPFEQVDRFARGTTRGHYSVGYSSYLVGTGSRGGRRGPAVHDGAYSNGGYGSGAYGDGYAGYGGGAYDDYAGWWGGPQWNGYASDTWRYRRNWRDREYQQAYDRATYNDPRSRYLRHCADGTLAPYTVPCSAAEGGGRAGRQDGRSGARSGGRPRSH